MCKNFIFVLKCRHCGAWDKNRSLVLPGSQFPTSPTSIFAPDPLLQDENRDDGAAGVADTETTTAAAAAVVVTAQPVVAALRQNRNTAGFTCMHVACTDMEGRGSRGSKDDDDDKEGEQQPRGNKRKREMMSRDDSSSGENNSSNRGDKDRNENKTAPEDEGADADHDTDHGTSWQARQRCPEYAMRQNMVVFLDRYCSPRCKQAFQLHLPSEPSPLRTMELAPVWERDSSKRLPEDEQTGDGKPQVRHADSRLKPERQPQPQEEKKKKRGKHTTVQNIMVVEALPDLRDSVLLTGLGVKTGNSSAGRHGRMLSGHHGESTGNMAHIREGEAGQDESESPSKKRIRTPLPGL